MHADNPSWILLTEKSRFNIINGAAERSFNLNNLTVSTRDGCRFALRSLFTTAKASVTREIYYPEMRYGLFRPHGTVAGVPFWETPLVINPLLADFMGYTYGCYRIFANVAGIKRLL